MKSKLAVCLFLLFLFTPIISTTPAAVDIHGAPIVTTPGSPTATLSDVTPPDLAGAFQVGDHEIAVGFTEPVDMNTADYYVSANLGSDYTGDGSRDNPWASIDKALDEAEGAPDNPVRIAVAEGAYPETVSMDEWESIYGGFDEITWVRDIDANLSIIDAGNDYYGVRGANHAEISGFTVQSARYGIYCSNGAPTVRSNRIEACTYGIRWSYQGGSGLIEENTVSGTYDDGIGVTGGSVTVSRNIVSNTGDSGVYCSGAQVTLSNNLIAASADDGIYVTGGASVTASNNIVVGSGDYGIYLSTYSGGSAIVKNCIIWDNVDDDLSYYASASYSCIEDGDWGEGNISSYPAFVDPAGGDYRLQASSPCIDRGTNGASWYGDEDLDGNDRVAYGNSALVVDMGPYEYNPLAGSARFTTVDYDGNHRIDHIEVVLDGNLNDDFGGLSMVVEGYALDPSTPYLTSLSGGGVEDDTFYIALQEGGAPDTGARPLTAIMGNTTLRKDAVLLPEGSGRPADGVSPALLSSTLGEGDGLFTLLFSEEVTTTGVAAGDIDPAATAAKLGTSPLIDQADDSAALTFQVSPTAVDAVQFFASDVFNLAGAELKVRDGNDNALSTDTDLPLVTLTDVTSPDFDSAFKLDSTTIAVNFDEPFDSGTIEAADFTVQANTVLSRTITASNRVELGLQDPIGGGEHPLVSIAPAGSIDDLSGNELNSGNDTPVTALDPPSDSYYYVSIEYGSDATGDGTPFNPFRTISYALDSISGNAGNPLRVAVAEGTYPENVSMDGYESLYGGYNGQNWSRDWSLYTTTIDGGLSGDTVTNAANATLDGFVITNAGDDGLSCYSSNFTVGNNLITGNADEGVYCYGVTGLEIASNLIVGNLDNGIYCIASSPLISENQISGNTDYGIYCGSGSSPIISGNTISGNYDGIYCSSGSLTPTITGNIIEGNQDDGINNYNASPGPIANNLILGNRGDGVYLSRPSSVLVKNNTIVDNGDDGVDAYSAVSPPEIRNCIIRGSGGNDLEDCQATFSCIQDGDPGRGNISSDPLFVGGGDYHLQSTEGSYYGGLWTADAFDSPCLNRGFYVDDYSLEPAPNGGRINMGAYGNTGEASKSTVYHPTPPTTPASSPTRTPAPTETPTPTRTPSPTATSAPTATRSPVPTPPPGQDVPFTEDFEGSWSNGAPALWSKEYIYRTHDWIKASGGQDANPPSAHGGSYNARFHISDYSHPITRLISPRLRFGDLTNNTSLIFWHAMAEFAPDRDELSVYYRSAESDPWTLLAAYDGSVPAWTRRELSLPDPSDDYFICFEGTANYAYGVCIDDVLVTGESAGSNLVLDSGDYNGDGTSDIAIFRGSNGMWSVRGVTRVYYGSSSDLPIPGDYNGDGAAEIAIFRGASGLWGVRGVTRAYYGASSDIPIPGDYNGDGSADIGIFRESDGLWAIAGVTRAYFGTSGDLPVPGDYTGEGRKKIALFRGSSGMWAIQGLPRVYFGSASDKVVPGDYNGDGTWEPGIFRSSSGMWAVQGVTRAYYGGTSDHPAPADYDGDDRDDVAIFRSTSGLWGIRNLSRAYFGGAGDVPVTR